MERVVRNNTRRSSLFKIQAQKSKFEEHLVDFSCCKLLQEYPQCSKYQQFLKELTQNFIQYCFQAGDQSPFLQGMNYNGRNFGFSNTLQSVQYKQWLPNTNKAFIIGQFNSWNPTTHQLNKLENNFFHVEIFSKLRQGQKIQLLIQDNQGKIYKIAPPSSRIVIYDQAQKEYFGIYTKYEKIKAEQSPSIINCLIGYQIDIHKTSLQDCIKNIGNIVHTKFNTVIIKNLFNFESSRQIESSPLNKFSLKISYQNTQLLKDFINLLNEQNIKVLFQIDYDHLKFEASSILEKGYLTNQNVFQFNLQNEKVFTFLLSCLSHYMTHFRISGYKFSHIDKIILKHDCLPRYNQQNFYSEKFIEDCSKESIIFAKMINMILKRINSSSFTYCTSKCFIPGMTLPLVEGGFGFNFTSQINSKKIDMIKIPENYAHIQNYFNCLTLNELDNDHKKQNLTKIFDFMFTPKGIIMENDLLLTGIEQQIDTYRQFIKGLNQIRSQAVFFVDNAKFTNKQIELSENVQCFSRSNYIFLFNHGETAQKSFIHKISQYQLIFSSKNCQTDKITISKENDGLGITIPSRSALILSKNKS